MRKTFRLILRIIIAFICLLVLISAPRSLRNLWQKRSIIWEKQAGLEREKAKNEELKQKLSEVQSTQFIEKEAREKLGMAKEGETVVLMPNDKWPMLNDENKTTSNVPNWQQWWNLFF